MGSFARHFVLPVCLLELAAAAVAHAARPAPPPGVTGEVAWRFEIPGNGVGRFVGVGADGRVYTTNFNPANLYAVTPNGALIWSLNLGIASGEWPITFGNDGTIYTGAVGVRAVNPNGTLRWAFDPPEWVICGPSVGPDGNIYAADDGVGGGLGFFSLDPGGRLLWSNPGDPPVTGLYFDLDEIVFGADRLVGGIHHWRSGPWITSYAFDLDGHQVWIRYYGPDGGPSSNPRLLPDGRLIYRSGQGSLVALQQSGIDDWVEPHPDGAQMLVTPAVGPDGAIYAGDVYGVQLWSADPDGSIRWVKGVAADEFLASASLGVSPDNRVLIAGGWTYSQVDGLTHGWIRGYDPADGDLFWQIDLELEQGKTQLTRTVRPAFSPNGDTAYLTTWFTGDGVGHSYLYAIALGDRVVGVPGQGSDGRDGPLVSISPNPCFGAGEILLRAVSGERASVTIYDPSGRAVRSLFEGRAEGGTMRLEWDLRDQAGRAVNPGVYLVAASTPEGRRVARLVVMK